MAFFKRPAHRDVKVINHITIEVYYLVPKVLKHNDPTSQNLDFYISSNIVAYKCLTEAKTYPKENGRHHVVAVAAERLPNQRRLE